MNRSGRAQVYPNCPDCALALGPPEKQMDLSILHPYAGNNPLIERLFAMKDVRAKYLEHVGKLVKTSFNVEQTKKDEAAIEKVIRSAIEKERKATVERGDGGPFGKKMFGPKGETRSSSLVPLVARRIESIEAQLAGKSQGYVPQMQKFPFDQKGPPKGFEPKERGSRSRPSVCLVPFSAMEYLVAL